MKLETRLKNDPVKYIQKGGVLNCTKKKKDVPAQKIHELEDLLRVFG